MNDLRIENLYVSYQTKDDKTRIMNSFSATVNAGECLVLLGPSGCGKSTLLTAVSGLKTPDRGRIFFGDKPFFDSRKNIDIPAEERNMGFVFQSYALWPHMTVYQNVALPLKARKLQRTEIDKRVNEILEIVHMNGYEKKYPGELSGGEKQRVALARSLVYRPELLLLDEPMANLDANLKSSLLQEIREIHREMGMTTVYVTHDQMEAFEIADRIAVMSDGKIMQLGTPREVYNYSKNLFVASFIGKNNIFKCNMGLPPFLGGCKAETAVTVRPEDIKISPDGVTDGKVVDVNYRGDTTEAVINADGWYISAKTTDNLLIPGDMIKFNVLRHHCI